MFVDDPQFRDLFLLPRFSQAWAGGLCPVLKDLHKREMPNVNTVLALIVISITWSFHLLLGLLAEAEALRVEEGVEATCGSSHMFLLKYAD